MIPQHVTIIMDGNGRWAKQKGKNRLFGHNNALESVRECCDFALHKGIKYLSLFAFSEENWNRPVEEVEGLMLLLKKAIDTQADDLIKNGIRMRVIGDLSRLPASLQNLVHGMEERSAHNTDLTLILMLSYSGKWDITQAVNKILAESKESPSLLEKPLSQAEFEKYLATAGIPDPDLMIRTSGEERISNYMLWQCAYTEFYFTDVLWPDFRKNDFQKALDSYEKRDRRYGKIK